MPDGQNWPMKAPHGLFQPWRCFRRELLLLPRPPYSQDRGSIIIARRRLFSASWNGPALAPPQPRCSGLCFVRFRTNTKAHLFRRCSASHKAYCLCGSSKTGWGSSRTAPGGMVPGVAGMTALAGGVCQGADEKVFSLSLSIPKIRGFEYQNPANLFKYFLFTFIYAFLCDADTGSVLSFTHAVHDNRFDQQTLVRRQR